MLEQPVIIRVTKFNEDSVKEFAASMEQAQNTSQTIIPIVIDSFGGQAYSLLEMISLIQASKTPIATIVPGKAMSCGAILFGMGSDGHRYIARNATLMIHDVSNFVGGKIEELKADVAESERISKMVFKMLKMI